MLVAATDRGSSGVSLSPLCVRAAPSLSDLPNRTGALERRGTKWPEFGRRVRLIGENFPEPVEVAIGANDSTITWRPPGNTTAASRGDEYLAILAPAGS